MIPVLVALVIIGILFFVILVGRPDDFRVTRSATIAAPAAHSPPIPSDAMIRKNTRVAIFGANAQAAVPIAYIIIVRSRVRVRPRRSATRPKIMPPIAQPIRRSAVSSPVHRKVAARAAAVPSGMSRRTGTALGAT